MYNATHAFFKLTSIVRICQLSPTCVRQCKKRYGEKWQPRQIDHQELPFKSILTRENAFLYRGCWSSRLVMLQIPVMPETALF